MMKELQEVIIIIFQYKHEQSQTKEKRHVLVCELYACIVARFVHTILHAKGFYNSQMRYAM